MKINEARDEALRIATEHGFTDASPLEDMALIHSEISEAVEDLRKGHPPSALWYVRPDKTVSDDEFQGMHNGVWTLYKPCGVPSELADIVIRVLHFAGKHGIDLEKAIEEKMAYNDSRPFKHGKII
jgi:NTP pyrophosphatase (non-canonical NTP hydrolase)